MSEQLADTLVRIAKRHRSAAKVFRENDYEPFAEQLETLAFQLEEIATQVREGTYAER